MDYYVVSIVNIGAEYVMSYVICKSNSEVGNLVKNLDTDKFKIAGISLMSNVKDIVEFVKKEENLEHGNK
jgi:hypothetical protein